MEVVGNFGSLPEVVMGKIMDYWAASEPSTFMKARLVNKFWKDEADSCIRRQSRQRICDWNPTVAVIPQTIGTPHIQVITSNTSRKLEWIVIPNYIGSTLSPSNLFPSSSAIVKFGTSDHFLSNRMMTFQFQSFLIKSKYGEHLKSLTLSDVKMTTCSLTGILGSCVHLKLLSLELVSFVIGDYELSALHFPSSLIKLDLIKLKAVQSRNIRTARIYYWILSSCCNQLTSLTLDKYAGNLEGNQISFPHVKELKIWNSSRRTNDISLQDRETVIFIGTENIKFPKLERLAFSNFQLVNGQSRQSVEQLHSFISRFKKSLIEIYLDLYAQPFIRYTRGRDSLLLWQRNNIIFPLITTATFFYPCNDVELQIIRDMLSKMPNLEILYLVRCKLRTNQLILQQLEYFGFFRTCRNMQVTAVLKRVDFESEMLRVDY